MANQFYRQRDIEHDGEIIYAFIVMEHIDAAKEYGPRRPVMHIRYPEGAGVSLVLPEVTQLHTILHSFITEMRVLQTME